MNQIGKQTQIKFSKYNIKVPIIIQVKIKQQTSKDTLKRIETTVKQKIMKQQTNKETLKRIQTTV